MIRYASSVSHSCIFSKPLNFLVRTARTQDDGASQYDVGETKRQSGDEVLHPIQSAMEQVKLVSELLAW